MCFEFIVDVLYIITPDYHVANKFVLDSTSSLSPQRIRTFLERETPDFSREREHFSSVFLAGGGGRASLLAVLGPPSL